MTNREKFIKNHLANLGRRIKQVRKAQGHTSYEKFAFANDIDRSIYGKYENGRNMNVDTLLKILYGLDITPAEFFAEGFDVIEKNLPRDSG